MFIRDRQIVAADQFGERVAAGIGIRLENAAAVVQGAPRMKSAISDAIFAVLCGCGHNIRTILAHLGDIITAILAAVLAALKAGNQRPYAQTGA